MAGPRFGGVRTAETEKRHQGGLVVGAIDGKKALFSREEVVPPTEFESVPPA